MLNNMCILNLLNSLTTEQEQKNNKPADKKLSIAYKLIKQFKIKIKLI